MAIVFKSRLGEILNFYNVSVHDLAKSVGSTPLTIQKIVDNEFVPSVKLAMLICVALNYYCNADQDIVKVEHLFCFVSNQEGGK